MATKAATGGTAVGDDETARPTRLTAQTLPCFVNSQSARMLSVPFSAACC